MRRAQSSDARPGGRIDGAESSWRDHSHIDEKDKRRIARSGIATARDPQLLRSWLNSFPGKPERPSLPKFKKKNFE